MPTRVWLVASYAIRILAIRVAPGIAVCRAVAAVAFVDEIRGYMVAVAWVVLSAAASLPTVAVAVNISRVATRIRPNPISLFTAGDFYLVTAIVDAFTVLALLETHTGLAFVVPARGVGNAAFATVGHRAG